jgi:RNA polymerase sigma-70 factor (ECF subfamily)
MIRGAAEGEAEARERFAGRYESVIRAYLGARWRRTPLVREIDDAAQEVFLACFKDDGALTRADPDRAGGFRAFLYGVTRNVSRRFEERRARAERQPDSRLDLEALEAREAPLSEVFDRAWAMALIREAVRLQEERAREKGERARRRVELLDLRFGEDLPIREIARRWEVDRAWLHHEYATAREEFVRCLRDVVREHMNGEPGDVDAECSRLARYVR